MTTGPAIHELLGWTAEEYARYTETGEAPTTAPAPKVIAAPASSETPAPWLHYSRWTVVMGASGRWVVASSQYGTLAPEPNIFASDDYKHARQRSDELNAQEAELLLAQDRDAHIHAHAQTEEN